MNTDIDTSIIAFLKWLHGDSPQSSQWNILKLLIAGVTNDAKRSAQPGFYLPPLEMLYLMPKSPLGPPGLWLAVRMMPPTALILRITQETAGVDMMPFWPITRWLICGREHQMHKETDCWTHGYEVEQSKEAKLQRIAWRYWLIRIWV